MLLQPTLPQLLSGVFQNSKIVHLFYLSVLGEKPQNFEKICTILDLYFIGKILSKSLVSEALELAGINENVLYDLDRVLSNHMKNVDNNANEHWNQIEDDKLLYFMLLSPPQNRNLVSTYVNASRNYSSCRNRWIRFWVPAIGIHHPEEKFVVGSMKQRAILLKEPIIFEAEKVTVKTAIRVKKESTYDSNRQTKNINILLCSVNILVFYGFYSTTMDRNYDNLL